MNVSARVREIFRRFYRKKRGSGQPDNKLDVIKISTVELRIACIRLYPMVEARERTMGRILIPFLSRRSREVECKLFECTVKTRCLLSAVGITVAFRVLVERTVKKN